MHPAPSIIAFTVLSGLGFGLLFFLGLGLPDVTGWTAFAFLVIAYFLSLSGLAASAFHLGHPERALKAFTQWRSSWLSREAWAAAITLTLFAIYGAALVFFSVRIAPLGWLASLAALATVLATSGIYTQLKTVPRWNHWTTPVLFAGYALAGGAILAGQISAGGMLLLALGALQLFAWQAGDRRFRDSGTTLATATQLKGGDLRAFEPPHTGTNYLLNEMVYVVARRHVVKLRVIAIILLVALPWLILMVLPFNHALAAIAVLSHLGGALVARWLFFAEAEHVVGLYYGLRPGN